MQYSIIASVGTKAGVTLDGNGNVYVSNAYPDGGADGTVWVIPWNGKSSGPQQQLVATLDPVREGLAVDERGSVFVANLDTGSGIEVVRDSPNPPGALDVWDLGSILAMIRILLRFKTSETKRHHSVLPTIPAMLSTAFIPAYRVSGRLQGVQAKARNRMAADSLHPRQRCFVCSVAGDGEHT